MKHNQFLKITIAVTITFTLFLYLFLNKQVVWRSRAGTNSIKFKVRLQGYHSQNSKIESQVILYEASGSAAVTDNNVILTADEQEVSHGEISLPDNFDSSQGYAFYFKPKKYLGKLFCSTGSKDSACQSPFIGLSGLTKVVVNPTSSTELDFSYDLIVTGDVAPEDGQIDAQDISKIVADLGKSSSQSADLKTDFNADGFVAVNDLAYALYTLSQNIKADTVGSQDISAQIQQVSPPDSVGFKEIKTGIFKGQDDQGKSYLKIEKGVKYTITNQTINNQNYQVIELLQ